MSKTPLPTAAARSCIRCCLALLFAVCAGPGCTSFRHDWRVAENFACFGEGIEGRWVGDWHSDKNGHHGKLCAIITHQSEGTYRAQFFATYAVMLPFSFEIPLTVHQSEGTYAFTGQTNLGRLAGGVFSYNGQANSTGFTAAYSSTRDHGTFTMQRVTQCDFSQ